MCYGASGELEGETDGGYDHISLYHIWNYQRLIFKQWDFSFHQLWLICTAGLYTAESPVTTGKEQTSAPTRECLQHTQWERREVQRYAEMCRLMFFVGCFSRTNHLITSAFCKKFLERCQADKSGSLLRRWQRTRWGFGIKNGSNLLWESIFMLITSLKLT